jgi:hypothetical protein
MLLVVPTKVGIALELVNHPFPTILSRVTMRGELESQQEERFPPSRE